MYPCVVESAHVGFVHRQPEVELAVEEEVVEEDPEDDPKPEPHLPEMQVPDLQPAFL